MDRLRHALLCVLLAAAAAAAEDPAPGNPAFERLWRKSAPEDRAAAFRHLDPADTAVLPLLAEGWRVPHWLVRGAAAEAASKVPEGPLRAQLRLDLLTHEESAIRGGIAYAFSLAPLPGDGESLAGALADRNAAVRRDAARALRALPSRGGLAALVAALGREREGSVRVWIVDALRGSTGADEGDEAAPWAAWWEKRKDAPDLAPPPDAPPERREFAGVKLETVSVPARGTGTARPHLLVLAPFGGNHASFRPWFDPLRERFHLTYVRLPTVKEITGSAGYGDAVPTYPVDRLARALEAWRKERGAEKVVVAAEGAACWIAETYALQYPQRTAGLLLVNGWIDAASYAASLQRMAARGSADERAVARNLLGMEPAARDEREEAWMARTSLHHRLLDPADLLGHHLWTRTREPQGFASVPPLRLDKHRNIEAPALLLFPGGSPFSGHHESDRARDAFPKGIVAALPDTRGLSWVDRHDEFLRVVRGFADRQGW